jgi:soluble lytic murein transglycosylase-like protein
VIWQESGGDSLAYSESGAVGLMQVMPRDGLAANFIMCGEKQDKPCFAERPTIKELQDPEFNIRYGCQMLADLNVWWGSLEGALRGYNPNGGETYVNTVMGLYHNIQNSL